MLLTSAAIALVMATETPPHTVTRAYQDFEVREYPALLVAEVEVEGPQTEAGSRAFGMLAGFIFGGNTARQDIAMTSPVTQESAGADRWTVRFIMPGQYTLDTLPRPGDGRVRLRQLPARKVAVIRYSGTWTQENYDQHLQALRAAVAREGLSTTGVPTWARYDPPFMPWFLRRNEIHLPLSAG